MKFLFVTVAILRQAFALGLVEIPSPVPSFALNQDRSLDGSPSISITFPDGYSDTMILSRYFANEEARLNRAEDCHYIGHLEGEPTACIGLTGCPGSDDLDITIMSEHSNRAMFQWLMDGSVKAIESPLKVYF